MTKLFSYAFNGIPKPLRISVVINDSGRTEVCIPEAPLPFIVIKNYPIEIDISADSHGPDVAILVEVNRP